MLVPYEVKLERFLLWNEARKLRLKIRSKKRKTNKRIKKQRDAWYCKKLELKYRYFEPEHEKSQTWYFIEWAKNLVL